MDLHIVNKSLTMNPVLDTALRCITGRATLLLMEDGVYNLLIGSPAAHLISQQGEGLSIKALAPDIRARGLEGRLIEAAEPVSDVEFVALVAEHDKTVTWF